MAGVEVGVVMVGVVLDRDQYNSEHTLLKYGPLVKHTFLKAWISTQTLAHGNGVSHLVHPRSGCGLTYDPAYMLDEQVWFDLRPSQCIQRMGLFDPWSSPCIKREGVVIQVYGLTMH